MNVADEARVVVRCRKWSTAGRGCLAILLAGAVLVGCGAESASRRADEPNRDRAEEDDTPREARRSRRANRREGSSKEEGGAVVGRPLPDLRLASLNGSRAVRLGDLRGKVVLLDVWASWCAPCKQELPMLDDMAGRLRGKGIEIVAVSVDDNREDAEGFLRSRSKWSIRLAHDPDGKLPSKLNPPKMPSSYFIDRNGVIRQVNAGFEQGDARKIESRLMALAAEG
jgi:cytochrome c biogenesis protein CcmG/thiol:disulfide interchange protein DsbE